MGEASDAPIENINKKSIAAKRDLLGAVDDVLYLGAFVFDKHHHRFSEFRKRLPTFLQLVTQRRTEPQKFTTQDPELSCY